MRWIANVAGRGCEREAQINKPKKKGEDKSKDEVAQITGKPLLVCLSHWPIYTSWLIWLSLSVTFLCSYNRTRTELHLHELSKQIWICTIRLKCKQNPFDFFIRHTHVHAHGLVTQSYSAAWCGRSNKILVNNFVLSSYNSAHLFLCCIKVFWVTDLS